MGTSGTPLQYVIVDHWVRSFIESDLFHKNVPFDNTTPIYLSNLPWKLRLGLGLDLELHCFSIFTENNETSTLSSVNFTEGNVLLKERTQMTNNKMKLHILGVPVNKLGNWLIVAFHSGIQHQVGLASQRQTCIR